MQGPEWFSSLRARVRSQYKRRWTRWLNRRIPPASSRKLSQRDIFILPTSWGLMFLGLMLLTLVTGINYQNAMILAVAFFLLSLAVLHILATTQSLLGLEISFRKSGDAFRGAAQDFEFEVRAGSRDRRGSEMGWLPGDYVRLQLAADQVAVMRISRLAERRGHHKLPRLLLTSCWPFGLMRAWSWLDFAVDGWVYPEPIEASGGLLAQGDVDASSIAGVRHVRSGQDEFMGLRAWAQGEPMTRVAWKKMAQSGQKLVRDFASETRVPLLIDFDAWPDAGTELRLSRMTALIVESAARGDAFGIRLPDQTIGPARGAAHRRDCLRSLAAFGSDRRAHGADVTPAAPGRVSPDAGHP